MQAGGQFIRARARLPVVYKSALLFQKIRSRPAVPKRHDCAASSRRSTPSKMTAIILAAILPTMLLADMVGAAQTAAAQQGFGNFFSYQQPRPRRTAKKRAAPAAEAADKTATAKVDAKKQAEKSGPAQPVSIIVSLADQHATIYDANGVVTQTRVSTGQPGHRTPTGVFSVIGKERWHHSNIYSGAPMPFMQRITWSGVAMHAGVVPGYPASHGCIRLPAGFAPQLYGMTKMGARVVVTPRDVKPVEFSHPLLPQPKMQEAPRALPPAPMQQASGTTLELASIATAAVNKDTDTSAAPSPKLLNPIAYAAALKQRATAEKAAADLAAKNALAAAQAAGTEARLAGDDVRKAEAELRTAEAKVAEVAARAAAPTASTTAMVQPASAGQTSANSIEADKAAAEAAVGRAQSALTEARANEAAKSPAAFAAVEAWKRAAAAAEAASDLITQADRRREQVSVFVSRKEGRIFIRQDWKDVWEAPVTIRDPERPLGTHVYTLTSAEPDGSSLRWTAISLPPESPASDGRRGRDKDKAEGETAAPTTAETAAGALDRIELPEGARERIAELLWTGGSLIVSDQPRSYEMSDNETDFIVLTR
jgi:lipoprotein-anchoring transpeptidase ErfK/SrfK